MNFSTKICLFISIFLIVYNEYLVYNIEKCRWKSMECRKGFNCTRILLVADPQLLGVQYDKNIYNSLAIWDSDRFLHKTFQQALHFTQPDIIVYLGDLLDEGNIANTESYNNYVHRFHNIFESDNVKSIHIPGDNDIGGENGEYILNSNVRRFEIEFSNGDIFEYKDRIRFFKINKMTLDISNPEENTNVDKIRIGISHLPILQPGGPLQRKILNEINPHILFTAHWHDSRIYVYPSTNSILFQENTIKVFDIKAYKDDNTYLEIMVPTSSYRMGKPKMGYGFALLEDNINDSMIFLKFSVLWSPSRFYYLKIYLVWLCLMGVYFVSRKCTRN